MKVWLNGVKLGKSEIVDDTRNPVWNLVFEGLIDGNSKLPRVKDNKFEFEVKDHNRFTRNAVEGRGVLSWNILDKPQISLTVPVRSGSKHVGTLFVTLIFRPVPFF